MPKLLVSLRLRLSEMLKPGCQLETRLKPSFDTYQLEDHLKLPIAAQQFKESKVQDHAVELILQDFLSGHLEVPKTVASIEFTTQILWTVATTEALKS